ncbi:MAG TPA: hypothetical protein VMD52_02505 [Patescibacteria group bacterium]|nr:hypothetical protein [Patescibacteria group bacterium]
MRKLFLALFAVMCVASLCLAQQPTAPAATHQAKPQVADHHMATGTIGAITAADTAKGTPATITIKEASGKEVTAIIKATTTAYDADGKPIAMDKIQSGQKAKLKYRMATVGNEAISIHLEK